jgi:hypothetical protein
MSLRIAKIAVLAIVVVTFTTLTVGSIGFTEEPAKAQNTTGPASNNMTNNSGITGTYDDSGSISKKK